MLRLRELWASYKDTHPTMAIRHGSAGRDRDKAHCAHAERIIAKVIQQKNTDTDAHMRFFPFLSMSLYLLCLCRLANHIPNHQE